MGSASRLLAIAEVDLPLAAPCAGRCGWWAHDFRPLSDVEVEYLALQVRFARRIEFHERDRDGDLFAAHEFLGRVLAAVGAGLGHTGGRAALALDVAGVV